MRSNVEDGEKADFDEGCCHDLLRPEKGDGCARGFGDKKAGWGVLCGSVDGLVDKGWGKREYWSCDFCTGEKMGWECVAEPDWESCAGGREDVSWGWKLSRGRSEVTESDGDWLSREKMKTEGTNGWAEREGRKRREKRHNSLHGGFLSKGFWGNDTRNRILTSGKKIQKEAQEQEWGGVGVYLI